MLPRPHEICLRSDNGKVRFVWLAGADPQILAKCIRLPKSERIKFAGLGTLVLIPAILAFFSGAYALSTLSNNPSIFVAGGLVWFFIVLSFDRFLVSTTHKSSLKTAKNYRGLVCRYFLAIVVGIAISHGRRFQSGEGWHSSENPVCFWNP